MLGVHSRYGLHTRAVTVYRDTLTEGFSHFVTSVTAPVASGWSGCRVGLAPTGKRHLFTAHTQIGNFTLSGDWAYVWHFNVEGTSGLSVNCAGNDACGNQPFGASFPRWKGNMTLDWYYRKFDTALTYLYSSPYTMTDQGLTPDSVPSYSQFNLTTTYTGFKNWTIYASIDNLFNRMPPFDPLYQTPSYGVPYDPSLYGRFQASCRLDG